VLQSFLDEVSKNTLLKSSELFYQFISLDEPKQYEEFKKRIEKVPAPTKVSEQFTLNGTAIVNFDSELESDCKKWNTSSNFMQEKLKMYLKLLIIVCMNLMLKY